MFNSSLVGLFWDLFSGGTLSTQGVQVEAEGSGDAEQHNPYYQKRLLVPPHVGLFGGSQPLGFY